MFIDKIGKTIYLEYGEPLRGFPCPICGTWYQSNGTGPSNNETVTEMLHKLPSEHYLGGFAPYFHDIAYLICGSGWAVHATYGKNGSVTAVDRESADDSYLTLMHYQVNCKCNIFNSWWYHRMAKRNYEFVDHFGQSSFNHGHKEGK